MIDFLSLFMKPKSSFKAIFKRVSYKTISQYMSQPTAAKRISFISNLVSRPWANGWLKRFTLNANLLNLTSWTLSNWLCQCMYIGALFKIIATAERFICIMRYGSKYRNYVILQLVLLKMFLYFMFIQLDVYVANVIVLLLLFLKMPLWISVTVLQI